MKTHSVFTRLLAFLFVINALGHSSARDIPESSDQKGNQNELEATRINSISMFAEKETSADGSGAPYHVRKLGLGGKKSMMMVHKESSMVFSMNEEGSDGEGTPKISAEKDDDSLKKSIGSLRVGDDQKEDKTMLEQPKASELTNSVVPRNANNPSKTNSNSQVKARLSSYTRPERQISEEPRAHEGTTTKKDEEKTKALFQAEKEILNLIHKDYKGMGHRKPPINNHEPRN